MKLGAGQARRPQLDLKIRWKTEIVWVAGGDTGGCAGPRCSFDIPQTQFFLLHSLKLISALFCSLLHLCPSSSHEDCADPWPPPCPVILECGLLHWAGLPSCAGSRNETLAQAQALLPHRLIKISLLYPKVNINPILWSFCGVSALGSIVNVWYLRVTQLKCRCFKWR